jgi:hypothetical protein
MPGKKVTEVIAEPLSELLEGTALPKWVSTVTWPYTALSCPCKERLQGRGTGGPPNCSSEESQVQSLTDHFN